MLTWRLDRDGATADHRVPRARRRWRPLLAPSVEVQIRRRSHHLASSPSVASRQIWHLARMLASAPTETGAIKPCLQSQARAIKVADWRPHQSLAQLVEGLWIEDLTILNEACCSELNIVEEVHTVYPLPVWISDKHIRGHRAPDDPPRDHHHPATPICCRSWWTSARCRSTAIP